jgi:hypothetical protein
MKTREGRTLDRLDDSQPGSDALGQCRFADAEIAAQQHDNADDKRPCDHLTQCPRRIRIVGNELLHVGVALAVSGQTTDF